MIPPLTPAYAAVPVRAAAPALRNDEPGSDEPGDDAPAGDRPDARRVAPTLFTVLSLALAPLVVALAVVLLPASAPAGTDNRPVIQVLPRPQTTANPAPAGQNSDTPATPTSPSART